MIHHYPSSYRQARERFLELAAPLGKPAHHPSGGQGPDGDTLFSDTLWLGPADAPRVLVLCSGTHGIEGHAGSAIQCDWLARLASGESRLPEGHAALLIHVLNPWGMAWQRRCDQNGIDLNRNFVDFSTRPPDNPGYAELRHTLMHDDPASRRARLDDFAGRHGREALEIAVSGGQYQDPLGPFYGGRSPAPGRCLVEQLIREYRLAQRQLLVIDLHTGLGPWGHGELICDHPPESSGTRRATELFGPMVTLPLAGTSSSVPKFGLMDYAWHAIMDGRGCFVTLEFGSYPTDQLFEVLLADHHLHAEAHGKIPAPGAHPVKQAMLEHFSPASKQWRELVMFQGRQVIAMALAGD